METRTTLGYRVLTHMGNFCVTRADGAFEYTSTTEPSPIPIDKAYKLVGSYLERHPTFPVPEVIKVEQVRTLTPVETASKELAGLLQSLCNRHGLDLGLTPDAMERQIAKELVDLGAGGATFIATGIPRTITR
jgi:hypothetical protein